MSSCLRFFCGDVWCTSVFRVCTTDCAAQVVEGVGHYELEQPRYDDLVAGHIADFLRGPVVASLAPS